jgi:uncharacterized Zn-finger protein
MGIIRAAAGSTSERMQPFETIYVDEGIVACNGGGGPLGHPRVYLNLGPAGKVECPYCSRLFIRGTAPLKRDDGAERPPQTPSP